MAPTLQTDGSGANSTADTSRRRSLLHAMSTTNQLLVSSAGINRGGSQRKSFARTSIIGDRIRLKSRRETNQDLPEEESEETPAARQVIFNEEIERLRIKLEDLDKLKENDDNLFSENHIRCWKHVLVRKEIPPCQRKPRMKRVWVLRKAPYNAQPLIPSPFDCAGPKFNQKGEIIPRSILGTVEEFQRMNLQKERLRTAQPQTIEALREFPDRSAPQERVLIASTPPPSGPTTPELPLRPATSSPDPQRFRLTSRQVQWQDKWTAATLQGEELVTTDVLPYWAPRSTFSYPGLPIGSCTRLPSSVLVSAVRPSAARSSRPSSRLRA